MVGAAITRRLRDTGAVILTIDRNNLNLTRQDQVHKFLAVEKPNVIIIAAALVGGILANRTRPAEFLTQNIQIATNIIASAHDFDVEKLLFLSSSCVYPRLAPQPLRETSVLTGPLEPTNEAYAIAKIAGQKLCESYQRQYGRHYFSVIPATVYGPEDNFDLDSGHVLPSLLRRFHEAKIKDTPEVVLWGTGSPVREFLYVDDLADAVAHLLNVPTPTGPINIPAIAETAILELAHQIAEVVGYHGRITTDSSKPDGMARKIVDGRLLAELGWKPKIPLHQGLTLTYQWLIDQMHNKRPVRGISTPSTAGPPQ